MSGPGFRFVVVDHPEQLRDKQEMRENRMHVMHNYLGKHRQKSASKTSQVEAAIRPKKKRPPPAEQLATRNYNDAAFSYATSPTSPSQQGSSSEKENMDGPFSIHGTTARSNAKAAPRKAVKRIYQPPTHGEHLVHGIGGRFNHSAYMRTMLEDVPAGPGAKLEPFGTWPAAIDPDLDVNSLKWSCSQRFGSNSLAANWIPALLRARHAFLSTCCISSAHDAVMTRALVPSHIQIPYKLERRWRIKREVISLVADCMGDPEMQTADETIIAVVQLLNSDIMGCDDRDMQVHQGGLLQMVHQRGGLEQLGVGGELAAVLTITNYLIAALREILPNIDYVNFASKQDTTRIPSARQPLPESPLYSRPNGFQNVQTHLYSGSETYVLLDIVRIITNRFIIENAHLESPTRRKCEAAGAGAYSTESMASLCAMIFNFLPAADKDFNDMNERYTYESVRLAARICAYALTHRLPFSIAATQLSKQDGILTALNKHNGDKALSIQLKHALMRTDISFCWDHLGGVLFWVTLIGGAAANPGPLADEERVGEAEDARKFLAAIAVRCAIVLSFQYGFAVLETLKRLVAIEAALAGSMAGEADGHDVGEDGSVLRNDKPASAFVGPVEPSHLQKGFADFALEFAEM